MKIHARKIIFFLLLALPSISYADFYQWVDKEGVTHITDDLGRVPAEYREKTTTHEQTRKEDQGTVEGAPQDEDMTRKTQEKKVELYGDYTLDWWKQAFSKKNDEIAKLEEKITTKRQFVEVFEGGRRFGQVFGSSEVETYNRYKAEIPQDDTTLQNLKDELVELARKATNAGVPRSIRGE